METEANSGNRDEVPKLQPIRSPFNITALSVLGLFILSLLYTLYFASAFLLPLTLAWVLALILKPLVRILAKAHISEGIAAVIVLLTVVALFITGVISLASPAADWIRRAPESLEKVERKIRGMLDSAQEITAAAQTVQHMTETASDETQKVELKKPGILNSVLSQTKAALIVSAEVFVLLFFFLAAGDIFMLKLVQILPRLQDKKRALEIVRETEKAISQYLVAMTLVNIYEGCAIGFGLWLIGMPNPLLWGVLAFAANYVPYLGALFAGSFVTLVALVSFESTGHALLAPLIYFGVNFSDNFIAPFIVGKRLVLNPVVVFLAIMFWGWIWGIPGVLLAVPMTMIVKIICDHSRVMAPFSEFLTATRSDKPVAVEMLKPNYAKGNA